MTQMYHSFLDELGFIDYQTSFEFQKEMNRFLEQAKRLYPIKPKEALYIASACAEIALEASMNMDDANHYTIKFSKFVFIYINTKPRKILVVQIIIMIF